MFDLRSLPRNLFTLIRTVWTKCNDVCLDIDTERGKSEAQAHAGRLWWLGPISTKAKHPDNHMYTSPDYWYLRKVIRILKLGSNDVFFDIGSGKGRVLCLVARKVVRKCVGIELLEPLCEVAVRNARRLRGRKSDIEIICSDAAFADLSEGTIYFMFNPFGPDTLRDTLHNIRSSLEQRPRRVRIVYYNSVYEKLVLEQCGWLEKFHEFCTVQGQKVTFWRSLQTEVIN